MSIVWPAAPVDRLIRDLFTNRKRQIAPMAKARAKATNGTKTSIMAAQERDRCTKAISIGTGCAEIPCCRDLSLSLPDNGVLFTITCIGGCLRSVELKETSMSVE